MAMEKDKSFDQIIKEKLQGIQPEFEPQNWDLLEQKLETSDANTPQVDDTLVDRIVYERLFNFEVPYDASTWKLLSARLDEELNFTQQILRYKALELVMMLLAIFTLFQYLPDIPNNPFEEHTTTPELEQDNLQPTASKDYVPAPPMSLKGASENSFSNKAIHSSQEQNIPEQTAEIATNELIQNNSALATVPPIDQLLPSRLSSAETNPELPNKLSLTFSQTGRLENLMRDKEELAIPKLQSIEAFEKIATRNLALLDIAERVVQLPPIKPLRFKRSRISVGIFGAQNYDDIATPPLEGDEEEWTSRYSLGYSFGVNVNLEKRLWTLSLGATYNVKPYKSAVTRLIGGNIDEGYSKINLKNIKLELLELPLSLQYNLWSNSEWRMYMFGGPTFQFLLEGNYDAKIDNIPTPSRPIPGESPNAGNNVVKGIAIGLLNGGTFKENFFLAGQLGFGIERRVSDKWSLFAQPSYQFPIKHWNKGFGFELEEADFQYEGIGSLREQFKTLSLILGLKVGI